MDKFVRIQFLVNLKNFSNFNEKFLKCVFWNSTSVQWSSNGCRSSPLESTFVQKIWFKQVCYCDHLTNFALFFDPHNASSDSSVLSLISYFGVGVSLICYVILIISRFWTKDKIKRNHAGKTLRRLYLINSVGLLFSNVSFILLIFFKPNVSLSLCKLNAIFLQFLLIFSFCFSVGIAYQHFSKLVRVFNNYERLFTLKLSLFAVSYAGVFTLCEAFLEYNADYTFMDACWLKAPFIYYFFVAPLCLILLVSLVFYIFVVVKVASIYNKNEEESYSYNRTRVIVLLFFSFISLNLTWLVGVFIVLASHIDQRLKFYLEMLFCVFNSFHGFSLLLGQLLAQKYSKSSGDYSSNSFTKTMITQSSTSKTGVDSSSGDCDSKLKKPEVKNRRPLVCPRSLYCYWCMVINKCCVKRRKRHSAKKINSKKLNLSGSFKKSPFLEFTLINHEIDSDNPNFQTFQTNLPNFDISFVNNNNKVNESVKNENLFSYFDSNRQERNISKNDVSSVSYDIEQDVFSSAV